MELHKIEKKHVFFLDETALRLNACPPRTLLATDENSYVIVEDDTSYARRYDMIACCNYDQVFPPVIYTPTERSDAGVKGINTKMLEEYIHQILASAIDATDIYPVYLVLDRATIHSVDKIKQSFIDWGCESVSEVIRMPTQAAKRMSPLDNSLFHDWKSQIRKHKRITPENIEQLMADEWNNTSSDILHSYYHHCLLFQRQDVYADCPVPAQHKHAS